MVGSVEGMAGSTEGLTGSMAAEGSMPEEDSMVVGGTAEVAIPLRPV